MASREQNITLIVQGMRLPLRVDSRREPDYRIAAAELNARAEAYKTQFAELASTNPQICFAMAALDRAYYLHRTREDVDTQPLMQQVKALNLAIDDFLNQYR
ncbi:MAG: cell division protein ZapA [Porphyromonas sp.]|nr:cell division protein ZapA [Porphyromonas sp.]